MKRFAVSSLSSVAMLFIYGSSAEAAETYTYVGNNYTFALSPYGTHMSVTVSLTLAVQLPLNATNFDAGPDVLSFSVFDGIYVHTESASDVLAFFTTDGAGEIVDWAFEVNNPLQSIVATCGGGGTTSRTFFCESTQPKDIAFEPYGIADVRDDPAVWTTGSDPSVPGLPGWAMVLTAAFLVATAGYLLLRRRNAQIA